MILKGWPLTELSDKELELHGIALFEGLFRRSTKRVLPLIEKAKMKRAKKAESVIWLRCVAVCMSAYLAFPMMALAENLSSDSAQPIRIRADMDGPQPLSLVGAIELARQNYPAIKATSLKSEAVRESITQAKTAYLPHVDILLDENYGTANNITGFLAPQTSYLTSVG